LSKDLFLRDRDTQVANLNAFREEFGRQFDSYRLSARKTSSRALAKVKKRQGRTERSIYPPIDFQSLREQHISLEYELALFATSLSNPITNEEGWTRLSCKFDEITMKERALLTAAWQEIEKHDKFRYDFYRYWFAVWGFGIALFVFLFSNLPTAFANMLKLVAYAQQQFDRALFWLLTEGHF
jgi:hypothetical protein